MSRDVHGCTSAAEDMDVRERPDIRGLRKNRHDPGLPILPNQLNRAQAQGSSADVSAASAVG